MNNNFIAVKGISNDASISILSIDDSSETVTSVLVYGDKQERASTSKIRYNAKGEPYFIKYGKREYLNQYMRV